jgi:photosystem II stability/assembly factor-like uncharacterized protein
MPLASILRVHAVSALEAWAGGSHGEVQKDKSVMPFAQFWHTTDGGKTWVNEGHVEYDADILGMHFINATLGFATGSAFPVGSILMRWDGNP